MRRVLQVAFVVVTLFILFNILLTVYAAGMGVFVGASNWGLHQQWGWSVLRPALALVPLALLARLPRRITLISGLFLLLMVVQIVLPNLRDKSVYLSALHPVNAVVMFAVTITLLWQTSQFLRNELRLEKKKEHI